MNENYVLGVLILLGAGVVMAAAIVPMTPPGAVDAPGDIGAGTGPTMTLEAEYAHEKMSFEENASVTASVVDSEGEPASDVDVIFTSLAYQGAFIPDRTTTTDSSGTATVTWKYVEPDHEMMRSMNQWPPYSHVTLYASATVDGERVEDVATIPVETGCYRCHSYWRDDTINYSESE